MTDRSLTALAHEAFRTGKVSPELQRFAAAEIDRRGLRPIIDRINAQLNGAFAPKQDEAA